MNTDIYALLIGIDCYPTPRRSSTQRSINLAGCVGDVNGVESFLKQEMGLPTTHILKLTSTNTPSDMPLEPAEKQPTRANILSGFQWLRDTAKSGDHVLIYYSGHGVRVTTPLRFQSLKFGDGFDEALVPSDYNYDSDQFLRDFELANILQTYRERGLEVTVVLDSCHSGGTTRTEPDLTETAPQTRIRGIGVISQNFPKPKVPVASDYDLQATIHRLSGRKRDFNVENGWLLEPEGYVLLAACRPAEFAYEHAFDGKEVRGVLTYYLLDSLKVFGVGASFEAIYNRVLAQVHALFPNQTPQLQGERNRGLFKRERITATTTIPILGVNGEEIILCAGQAQGIKPGHEFLVFAAGETDFGSEQRRAQVRVTDVGATTSRSEIVKRFNSASIEKGDQARIESGPSASKRTVKLNWPEALSAEAIRTFRALEEALRTEQSNGITVSTNGAADLTLSLSPEHEYAISARVDGGTLNAITGVCAGKKNSVSVLIKQLAHIAKYLNVYELKNYDSISPSRVRITAELLGVQSEYLLGTKPAPEPLPKNQAPPEFKTGQWTFLKITNNSSQVLNITVLDLRPNWSISQVYPARAASFEPLDPGLSLTLPLLASLPEGYDVGDDLFKIVATTGPSTFRFLELPELTRLLNEVDWLDKPQSQLEALKNAFSEETGMRDFEAPGASSSNWTTSEVNVRVIRS